jgi:hypothetical protein
MAQSRKALAKGVWATRRMRVLMVADTAAAIMAALVGAFAAWAVHGPSVQALLELPQRRTLEF